LRFWTYGSRFVPRGSSGVGRIGFLGAAFFGADLESRMLGGSIWLHCSASSANRVQVRAMSRRISLILGLGAWSAITRHSAARSLQFSAVTMAVPKGTPRINSQKETPPRPGRNQRGVQCSWQVLGLGASAKLAQQPKTDLNVPKIFTEYSEGPSFHANFYSSS
jgi:hypothetical protein